MLNFRGSDLNTKAFSVVNTWTDLKIVYMYVIYYQIITDYLTYCLGASLLKLKTQKLTLNFRATNF